MLPKLAEQGALEVMLVLMPESSRSSIAYWTIKAPSKLRARADSESVIVDGLSSPKPKKPASSKAPEFPALAASREPIPACFPSNNSCVARTNNCSGHGICIDKYRANRGRHDGEKRDEEGRPVCFVCHCQSTLNGDGKKGNGMSTTQWAGNTCQKIDISAPFWLISGFTVAIIGALTFAIGLLFSVGEEKLPGVIGAGVSRK